jgi:hypothetical protein
MFRSIAVLTLIGCASAHTATLPAYNVSAYCKTQADYNDCMTYEMKAKASLQRKLAHYRDKKWLAFCATGIKTDPPLAAQSYAHLSECLFHVESRLHLSR